MASSLIAQRYAKALFQAATQAGDLPQATALASALSEAMQQPSVRAFVADRGIRPEERLKALRDAFGESMSGSFDRCLKMTFDNHREGEIAGILEAFLDLARSKDRRVKAGIKVASPMTPAQRKTLEGALSRQLKRQVELIPVVDHSLLGGAVLEMEETVYDGSVKSALAKLKAALLKEPKRKAAAAPKAGKKKAKKKAAPKKKAAKKKTAPKAKKKSSKKKAAPKKAKQAAKKAKTKTKKSSKKKSR